MFAWLLLASYICIMSISQSTDHMIVGGSTISASEHPYIAVILWNSGSLQCGGSIIKKEHPSVILTAAHCVFGFDVTSTHFVRLYASDYNGAYDATSNNYIDVTIYHAVVHEDYTDEHIGDDIALLLIAEDISHISRLQTVSINKLANNDAEPWSSGEDLQVAGYGHDLSGGPPTPTLEDVIVPYITRAACDALHVETISNEMICAGTVGYDACQGDSGGPLLIPGTNEQIGIVSWGYGCADITGIYTNVGVYYDWVWDNIALSDNIALPDNITILVICNEYETVTNEIEDDIDIVSDEMVRYQIMTDDTTAKLTIAINVQSGDADLYVRFGAAPTESLFDCRPYLWSGTEACVFDPAQVGTYYIMVSAYDSVVGLSVTAHKFQCVDDEFETISSKSYSSDSDSHSSDGVPITYALAVVAGSVDNDQSVDEPEVTELDDDDDDDDDDDLLDTETDSDDVEEVVSESIDSDTSTEEDASTDDEGLIASLFGRSSNSHLSGSKTVIDGEEDVDISLSANTLFNLWMMVAGFATVNVLICVTYYVLRKKTQNEVSFDETNSV